MKKLLIIVILAGSFNSIAQDTRLFNNTWYLHNLIVNGEGNIPPVNNELPFVALDFIEVDQTIETSACPESAGGGEVIYNGTTSFNLSTFAYLAGGCYGDPENEIYNTLYIEDYWANNTFGDFAYTITEDGSNITLVVTNPSGDTAIYGNELLSSESFNENSFTIYPSPASTILNIEKKDVFITNISIYDISGRLVYLDKPINSELSSINIQNLKKGVYFITIQDEQNRSFTKRFIKSGN
ncbi:MAG: T9SS type A sorting domain-containing protein [Flavobacteriaceae bacterium]